ncbi:DUF602-domain-containing protein [Massarina eburnea CBS 473.64]|uniref:DUF602-domain-containing protein n=1 Tax=Massarina eburnea CBS 473.64 TaxID=1395130 RepID=A0A6A6SD95_9PLEO|nr:DUF602-domain-containing protein [Massarina eburnea CBS 473.64]
MDSMWGIIAKIPESGPSAANAITYTTIFGAIRQSLIVDVPTDQSDSEIAARCEHGIVDGRRIWEEVVRKWRNADLIIEEELVCSMARLLLIGSRPRDWDDVLSLIEQTMDIPRLVPRLGTTARTDAGLLRVRAPHTPIEYKFDDDHLSPDQGPQRGDEFLALTRHTKGKYTPLTYAAPGNNTLSIIQEACQKVVANKAAEEYWQIITDPTTYGVIPDVNNLNTRLRVMRQNRASNAAAQSLQEDFVENDHELRPGTLRIAMSTCVRDKNNHNSLKHATKILNIMTSNLPDADPKTVTMYAELALTFPLAKGDDLVDALSHLQPIIKNIRIQLGVGAEDQRDRKGAIRLFGPARQDAVNALRKIYAVYDRLLLSDMLVEERKPPFKAEKARLSAFLNRETFKNQGPERKWEMTKEAPDAEGEVPGEDRLNGGDGGIMGNDGGSIPKRRELVKEAAKAPTAAQIKEAQQESQDHAWNHCALTSAPLATPVVSDAAGTLYNKDSMLEYLLNVEERTKEQEDVVKGRVKGLRDVVEVKFEVAENNGNGSGRREKWVCPITRVEMGYGAKAMYLVPCGHAFAGSVVREVGEERLCAQCNEAYAENDVIPILPAASADIARLSLRIKSLQEKGLTHALKKAPGSKKRKKGAEKETNENGDATVSTTKNTSSEDDKKAAKPGKKEKEALPTNNGIKNASTAYLTRKVLEEQEERNKRRKLGQNENVKSLFSKGSAAPSSKNSADYMTRGFSMGKK